MAALLCAGGIQALSSGRSWAFSTGQSQLLLFACVIVRGALECCDVRKEG